MCSSDESNSGTIGEFFRSALETALIADGISMRKFAAMARIPYPTVKDYFKGKKKPSRITAHKILSAWTTYQGKNAAKLGRKRRVMILAQELEDEAQKLLSKAKELRQSL